jgi:hypothetical protein
MALMPTGRMGPPPGALPPMRMTASWSGSNDPTEYKSAARRCAADGELPSDPQQTTTDRHRPDRKLCKKPVSPFIIAPRAQASRRCETQASLGGKAAKLCYRFGPLTPSARSANLIAGDETKNGFPAPNKELAPNHKQPLDTKSPIQVRIRPLQRGVQCEPEARAPKNSNLVCRQVADAIGASAGRYLARFRGFVRLGRRSDVNQHRTGTLLQRGLPTLIRRRESAKQEGPDRRR